MRAHWAVHPPSTTRVVPVTSREASAARNTTAPPQVFHLAEPAEQDLGQQRIAPVALEERLADAGGEETRLSGMGLGIQEE
jgi:hypothetical protein